MPIHNDNGTDRPMLKVTTNYGGEWKNPESSDIRLAEYNRNNGSQVVAPKMKPLTPDGARVGGKRPVIFHKDGTYSLPRGTTEWDYPELFQNGKPNDPDFEPKTAPKKRAQRKPVKPDKGLDEALDNDLKKRNIRTRLK